MISLILKGKKVVCTLTHTDSEVQEFAGEESAKFKKVFAEKHDITQGILHKGNYVTAEVKMKSGDKGFVDAVMMDVVRNQMGYDIEQGV